MERPYYLIKLGQNLFLRRKKSNFSQAELAFRAHVDINYVGEIERGEKNPSIRILRKICRPLKTNIKDLFEGL